MDFPFEGDRSEGFRIALEACPNGMVVVDEAGTVLFANRVAEQMFGYPDGLAGRNVDDLVPSDLAAGHAQERGRYLRAPMQRAMGTGRDLLARRADGSTFSVEIGLNPLRSTSGWLVVGSVVDISPRVQLEREKADAQARALEGQRLDSLGLLAGGVAHDFNNLLVGVLGNASIAATLVPTAGPAAECLQDVIRAAEQAADLARKMLEYSGRGRFLVESVDLSALADDLRPLLRSMVSRRIDLRFHCAPALPRVDADAAQLRQVLLNLVSNAAEAIPDDVAGTVSVATGLVRVDSAYAATAQFGELVPGSYVYFEVSDTGAGIARERLPRIFDPFYTTKALGHGLGLAAAAGIVRGHRGAITVYSEPGRGTTMKVLLPASVTVVADPPAPSAVPRRGTVLVVDDEPTVRRFCQRALPNGGWEVLTAEDGPRAIALYEERHAHIDVVLLDVSMPAMSGADVFHELRRIRPGVRVVLSSGFSEQEATVRFAGKRLAGFLRKPYSLDQLYQALARAHDLGG